MKDYEFHDPTSHKIKLLETARHENAQQQKMVNSNICVQKVPHQFAILPKYEKTHKDKNENKTKRKQEMELYSLCAICNKFGIISLSFPLQEENFINKHYRYIRNCDI